MQEQVLAVQRMQDYIEEHLGRTSRWRRFLPYRCIPHGIRTGCLPSSPADPGGLYPQAAAFQVGAEAEGQGVPDRGCGV